MSSDEWKTVYGGETCKKCKTKAPTDETLLCRVCFYRTPVDRQYHTITPYPVLVARVPRKNNSADEHATLQHTENRLAHVQGRVARVVVDVLIVHDVHVVVFAPDNDNNSRVSSVVACQAVLRGDL
jgi:hypothetical protein